MTVSADRGRHSVSLRALLPNSAVPDRHSSDRPLLHHLDEALAEALVVCCNKRHGDEPPPSQAHASLPLHLGRGITPVDCVGDDELPSRQRMHVQKIKSSWNDKGLRVILWQTVEAEGSWSTCTRIH